MKFKNFGSRMSPGRMRTCVWFASQCHWETSAVSRPNLDGSCPEMWRPGLNRVSFVRMGLFTGEGSLTRPRQAHFSGTRVRANTGRTGTG